MRYLILLNLLFACVSAHPALGEGRWTQLPSPTTVVLKRVFFADSATGWTGGDSALILATTNGGNSWDVQYRKPFSVVEDLFFLDRQLGWALVSNFDSLRTEILSTTNGGQTWTSKLWDEPFEFMSRIRFLDSLNGWMGSFSGTIRRTRDGGDTWQLPDSIGGLCYGMPINGLHLRNASSILATGSQLDFAGLVMETTTGGAVWSAMCVPPTGIFDLEFIDSTTILGSGGEFDIGAVIFHSSDAGATWTHDLLPIYGVGTALDFRTPREAWATLGFAEFLIFSVDTGRTWTYVPTPGLLGINDLVFTDSTHGFGVGDSGAIIRYVHGSSSIGDPVPRPIPAGARLMQSFPNPFNSSCMIAYELSRESEVLLEIVDIRGAVVGVADKGIRPAGMHRAVFSAGSLATGAYWYRLTARDVHSGVEPPLTLVRQMLLLR